MKRLLAISILLVLPLFVFAQDYEKGKYLLEIEQYNNARKHFQEILNSKPSDALALYYMGESYYLQHKMDSAKVLYTDGITANPKVGINLVGQGKLLYKSNPTAAKALFDQALGMTKSKETEIPEALATFYLDQKDGAKALEMTDLALKATDKNPNLYILEGDSWLLKGDGSKALESYERKALPLNRESAKTLYKVGKLYLKTRNYELAMQYFNNALEKDPNYSPAYKEIAEVYSKAGQNQKAIAAFEKYLAIADKDPESNFRYASFLFLNKDYNNTIKILSTYPQGNYVINRLLAYSYYETGNYDKALENLDLLFKTAKPEQIIASDYEYSGKTYAKKGNTQLALDNFKKALEKDPSKTDNWVEIGNIQLQLKNFNEAAVAYENKLTKTKGTANDYLNYGKILYYQTAFKKADSAFSILVTMVPNMPHGYLWRAKANEQLDQDMKLALAKPYYEKFIELADVAKFKSELINAYSYLGSYYSQTKNNEESAKAWKKVKELDPTNKNANEALKNWK